MWQLPKMSTSEILIYLRKSRTDDPTLTVEEVLSKHEQMLNDWVHRNINEYDAIPEENRYREVVSGETIESRPQIQEVLRRVESPKYKAILCADPQRLSRGDLEDIGRLVKLLRYSNTIVITLQYIYDLRDDHDREAFERELKRGNEFLEYQKRIMNNGRLLSVQNGNFIGQFAPYGYKKVSYKDGKRTCYTLEIVPEEAEIVRMVFQMYADGMGSHLIARKLNEMGIPSPRGSVWVPGTFAKMRTNEHYIGMVRWNYRKTMYTVDEGEVVRTRPVSDDYLLYPGKHEAIIDRELWDRVQEIRNKIPPVKGKARCVNPFAGLIYCQCGRTMSRRTYKNKGVEKTPPRLVCDAPDPCGTGSCFESEMLDEVVRILKDAIADFELQIKSNNNSSLDLHNQLITQAEKRLEELNKLEIAQWEKYTMEGMPKHIFDQLNEKVLAEKAEVQQALCVARKSVPEPVDYEKKLRMFSDALELLLDEDAPALKKNLLLKECIDRIVYRRNRKQGNRRWGEPEPIELEVFLKV